MAFDLILASSSQVRSTLLTQAMIPHRALPARVDEEAAKLALVADGASARDIADTLAELKARKLAERYPTAFVLGCDQTLVLADRLYSKPDTENQAIDQLTELQGQTHLLHSALVLYDRGQPVWRHVATCRMTMRGLSRAFITAYVNRNWPAISNSVGAYLIESEGIALFSNVDGEHTAILGLPLPPLIGYLAIRGLIAT